MEVCLFHVITQESRLTEVPLFYVIHGEAGWRIKWGQIHERLKNLDLTLRAKGISAFNAFCSILCKLGSVLA